ncbi:unnamed protein product [Rodentolepis nana]|uniref:EGF-like domain-containing protein n=1 Tax=Rodentolepis nana TaxID=102285 RepID=A0A0R3TRM9_RODNA|nr:unnamed protein product [Rodentolepis nana]
MTETPIIYVLQDDFECICKKDSVWDQSTQSCKPINPCFPKGYVPCSKEGTISCVALNMQTPLCICKPEYTGKDCGQLRNACLRRFNKTDANGNTNCGIIQGNICNPILGTDFYKCLCGMGWVASPTLPYDNCDVLNDPCNNVAIDEVDGTTAETNSTVNSKKGPRIGATIDCQNGGFCSSSPDNSKAACLCPSTASGEQGFTGALTACFACTYSGTYCEIPRGMWSGWTKYSDCRDKDCGISRYKWRRRQCLNDTVTIDNPDMNPEKNSINCFGISEEHLIHANGFRSKDFVEETRQIPVHSICTPAQPMLRNCEDSVPCETYRLSGYYRREIFHFPTLHTFLIFLLIELIVTYLLYKTCGFWLVRSILRGFESLKAKRAARHALGTQKAVTYVCEEISRNEAQNILTRTPTPQLFIDGRVESRSGSPERLDNEQYLAIIRQRIIQRILEVVEKKEKEKVKFYRELIFSKARRMGKSTICTLLGWAISSVRFTTTFVRTFRAVIRTETSRPPNEKTVELTGERKGRIPGALTRQLAIISSGRKDHQVGGERRTLSNLKEGTKQAGKTLVGKVEEKTLSMVNLLGSYLPKSPSKSREDTAVVKDTTCTSENLVVEEEEEEEGIKGEKKRAVLTDQKPVPQKRPRRKSKHKAYISDTLDQISSSEFNTDTDDNDDNDRTLTPDPMPETQLKGSKPEENTISLRPFIPESRQSHRKHGKDSEGVSKRIERKKETHSTKRLPSRKDLNKPSGTFQINAAQRFTSTTGEHNLPKIPEDKTVTDDMHAPVPVTSTNRRIRKTTSAGVFEKGGRNMEAGESGGPSGLPPRPIRTTSYPQTRYPPAVVEVSLEDEDDEAKHSRKHVTAKPDEKQTQK